MMTCRLVVIFSYSVLRTELAISENSSLVHKDDRNHSINTGTEHKLPLAIFGGVVLSEGMH